MLHEIFSDAGVLSTGIALFVSVNALFFKADDFFSKEFREDVAVRLLCLDPEKRKGAWSTFFVILFDKIFSKVSDVSDSRFQIRKYLNVRTFLKSSLASSISIVLIYLIGITIGPEYITKLFFNNPHSLDYIGPFLIAALALNLVPDYISLIETRLIISLIEKNRGYIKLIAFLFIDALLTLIIFLTVGSCMLLIAGALMGSGNSLLGIVETIHRHWKEMVWLENGPPNALGIFFFSTFLTSIWLWLYGISNMLLFTLGRTESMVKIVKYILPIEEKPFRSIGIVAGILIVSAYWVSALIINIA